MLDRENNVMLDRIFTAEHLLADFDHLVKSESADWPFADPKNVAVFTTIQVLRRGQPILHVSHDDEDGAWQFHTGAQQVSARDAMIVSLKEIVEHDPTIRELADLPCGWHAERDGVGDSWRRVQNRSV
jgi:hypothetical protein